MKTIVICGSSKFIKKIQEIEESFSRNGWCVLGKIVNVSGKEYNEKEKEYLLQAQFHKIDLSDVVYIVNVNSYTGKDTKSEIDYALSKNKQVLYYDNQIEMFISEDD